VWKTVLYTYVWTFGQLRNNEGSDDNARKAVGDLGSVWESWYLELLVHVADLHDDSCLRVFGLTVQ
jgi:hypothetical protein